MKANFNSYSSWNAYLAGLVALAYAVSFVILKDQLWSALFLMLGGAFALPVVLALYSKLKEVDQNFALLALILGIAGSLGALVHGGYDLANVLNPPATVEDLPFAVNPRGLLSFGVMGAAILKFSWLMKRGRAFPNNLAWLGALSGALLVLIYLARLIVLNPTSPLLLYPVLIEGFIVNPLWYIWLGSTLSKR
ncbi:hypothetical protein HYS93_01185 [Candidatus Daviesbacteria bacterium]|nr:hypothetical protein [Candidatus Daviesbacteria bacterium]